MSKPSDLHPALTDYRLRIVGQLIRDARHKAVLRHDTSIGDNAWVLGVSGFNCCCYAIASAVERYKEWLSVIEDGLHFVFAIGGVPLRFYRGEPDDAPKRTLARNFPEVQAHQIALLFPDQETPKHDALRFAVETDEFGEVSQVTLVQVDVALNPVGEGWVILAQEETGKVAQFPSREEGKDLGPPNVDSQQKPEEKHDPRKK